MPGIEWRIGAALRQKPAAEISGWGAFRRLSHCARYRFAVRVLRSDRNLGRTPLIRIAPAREISMVIGAYFGSRFLNEGHVARYDAEGVG